MAKWLLVVELTLNPFPFVRDDDVHTLCSKPVMKFTVAAVALVSFIPAVLGLTINTP